MLRIILGVIAGFVAWSILWIGSDQMLHMFSPVWYGVQKNAMALAVANGEAYSAESLVVIIDLVRSIIASVIAGYLAALAAGENRRTPLVLGAILLAVGVAVQVHVWNVYPAWFHILFLILLIPMTILGGKMKTTA